MKINTIIPTLFSSLLFAGSHEVCESCLPCDYDCSAHLDHTDHAGHNHYTTPISVMGAHTHEQGEWMISYRYMHMVMDSLHSGSSSVSSAGMAFPIDMDMEMHMIGAMYAATDQLTFMGMVNYLNSDMTMSMPMMGGVFEMNTRGFGDTRLAGIYQFDQNWIGSLGLSLPTGSITETFTNPMGMEARAGYNMQLGSGSYEFRPTLTYVWEQNDLSCGAQASYVSRLNDNDQGYKWGEEMRFQAWAAYQAADELSFSARLAYLDQSGVRGTDSAMLMATQPQSITNSDNTGRKRVDLGLGVNVVLPEGYGTLNFEYIQPLFEHVEGTQLTLDRSLVVGYTHAW